MFFLWSLLCHSGSHTCLLQTCFTQGCSSEGTNGSWNPAPALSPSEHSSSVWNGTCQLLAKSPVQASNGTRNLAQQIEKLSLWCLTSGLVMLTDRKESSTHETWLSQNFCYQLAKEARFFRKQRGGTVRNRLSLHFKGQGISFHVLHSLEIKGYMI